ncbi:unnamed protein product [Trichobilharzia regenti]|nr:unnamed protein product [Trichobilharzia regenti]
MFRFNEYELLMKRIEKNIRDTRKKGTSSNASTTHTTSVNQLSAIHHSTPIQIAVTTTTPTTPAKEAMTTTLQTTSAKTLSNANSMNSLSDTAKLSVSLQEGSSQCLDRSDEHLSSSSMTSGISFQKSVHSLAVDQSETRILANSSNNIPTVTQTPLDDHPLTTSLLEVNQTTKNDNKSYKYIKSTSKLNSFKASLYTFGDNSQHVTLHNESKSNAADDNIAVDSSKHLSILDTINMKAVYQRNDPEISGSTLTHQNHHQSNKAESTTDHHIRPTISSQTNPSTSGVRRFIHTFLSSAMDLKVFGEPVPANEHPQLIVCDESCITILKQFYISQSLSNESTSKGSDCSRPPASVCQLLLANPDIYVNDREFTSIIAFALTTSEYERKLVDLHSTLQVSTQLTSDVQLGQSALAKYFHVIQFILPFTFSKTQLNQIN